MWLIVLSPKELKNESRYYEYCALIHVPFFQNVFLLRLVNLYTRFRMPKATHFIEFTVHYFSYRDIKLC